MKKLLIALGVASVLATPAMANPSLDSGSLVFSGLITGQTCEISSETQYQHIQLPTVSLDALNAGDDTHVPFNIKVGNCPADQLPVLGFEPFDGSISENGFLLNEEANNPAENVGIVLLQEQGSGYISIDLNDSDEGYVPQERSSVGGLDNYTFKLAADYAYTSDNGSVSPGAVSSRLPFVVVYK